MKMKICFAALALAASCVSADPYEYSAPTYSAPTYPTYTVPTYTPPSYSYDVSTGSSYRTTPTYGGGARVSGYNYNTGSMWNTTIDANGNMRGTDAQGNYWRYNRSTGSYTNSNGKMCFGKGATRTCTE